MYFVRFVLFCSDTVNDFLAKNCPFIAGAIASVASAPFALGVGGTIVAGYALTVLTRLRNTAKIAEKHIVDSGGRQHQ